MTMHLHNLTFAEWSLLATAGAIFLVILYLEDRVRHRRAVSSLQFWAILANRAGQKSGKSIQDAPSFLLQLLCMLALLFAAAAPEWIPDTSTGKSHILLLDTSSWTHQRNGQGSILDREKALALKYINTLPAADPVMLTRADGLVTPLTPFTTDRRLLRQRLSEAQPSLLALNLNEALAFAKQAGALFPSGETQVVYTGPALIDKPVDSALGPRDIRVLLVEASPRHCGISRVGLSRDDRVRSNWKMLVFLRNYGATACDMSLQTKLGGTVLPAKQEHLAPGEDIRADYDFPSTQSEPLAITLTPEDGLSIDHHVALQLPSPTRIRIAVYTSRPEAIRDLVELIPEASVSLRREEEYRPGATDADLIILDRMSLVTPSRTPTLWITPPLANSPFPVISSVVGPTRVQWNPGTPVAQGLHSEDLPMPSAKVYRLREGDTPVLSILNGPVVVVRKAQEGRAARAILGFDPANDKVRYEIAVPLLFINLVRWLAAEKLAPAQIAIGHVGAEQIDLGDGESLNDVEVEGNRVAAMTPQNRQVQLFAAQPAAIGFLNEGQNEQLQMILPEIAETRWKPSAWQNGKPYSFAPHVPGDLWRWLVMGGIAAMSLEWWLYANARFPLIQWWFAFFRWSKAAKANGHREL